ncbi:tetratricopeptide repeat protein [Oceanimonas smirnovii]|uniref:tetratricopeptide repeat protein n=1 Tax=Oceanimonas smirnovii TaxID=264574 RepID=UPI00376F8D57
MSNKIKKFLNSLENWKENVKFKAFDATGDDELSQIVAMQRNKDIDGLLSVWKKKLEQDYFELPHPDFPSKVTRAVYNSQHGMANFVFMIDNENKLPWIFGQCEGFIDYIITHKHHFKTSLSNDGPITAQIKNLFKLQQNNLQFRDKRFGFLLEQTRPYHFFYDHLKYFYFFKSISTNAASKPLQEKKSFFKTNKKNSSTEDFTFLFPSVLGNNMLNQRGNSQVKELNEKMEEIVYKDAIQDLPSQRKENTLRVWYGITGQKRSWLQQIEAIDNIVSYLLPHFPSIQIYIDGMTAPDSETISNYEDEEIFYQITELLDGKCEVHSCIGQDYRYKVKICSTIDFFIANAGTGCLTPLRFCKKPGVLHSNKRLFTFPDNYSNLIKKFKPEFQLDVPDASMPHRADFASYHIPWQHIFNLTAEVLNQTKGTDIKPIEVPAVEDVAKAYAAQEQAKKKKLMTFTAIESRIKSTDKSPDILREVALSFEHSGDIETALKIMQKALELRPSGPFIKKKLNEYTQILQEKGNQP